MEVLSNPQLVAQPIPHTPFLVRPIIPIGGTVLLFGKRTAGKTALALTLAHNIIRGDKFGGHYQCSQGKVAYLQVDTPLLTQQDRVIRLQQTLGLNPPELLWLLNDSSIDIFTEIAEDAPWLQQLHDFQPDILIVDTLRKVHRMDENLSDTPVAVYAAFRSIVPVGCVLLYVHHEKKTHMDARQDEMFRGSGAWIDEADTALNLIRERGSKGRRLEFPKTRTCDDQPPLHMAFNDDTLLLEASDPKEALLLDMMMKGLPRDQIVHQLTNKDRWGEQAWSRATVFRRLEGYSPS